MIMRPPDMGRFEYVVLASLRAKQLTRGCLPRVTGTHKSAVTARMEVSEGKVIASLEAPAAALEDAVSADAS